MMPFEECRKFDGCNVNKCPLHPDYEKLQAHPMDKETKCTLSKKARLRIGLKYRLKNKGLFPRELMWVNLSQEEKEKRLLTLGFDKRGTNIPSQEIKTNLHISNEQKTSQIAIKSEVKPHV